jgi:hypothetical protein
MIVGGDGWRRLEEGERESERDVASWKKRGFILEPWQQQL